MQIHERLRVLRMLKGWSQEEMAEKLDYSLSGYAKVERGESDIGIQKLEKISKALGLDLGTILNFNETNILNYTGDSIVTSHPVQCTIILSESQCAHELEKNQLLLQERDKEIGYLKEEATHLKEIIALLRRNS